MKGDLEPQYFTLRTIKKHGNLSLYNVLKISPNFGLGVLINFVLIEKKSVLHFYPSMRRLMATASFITALMATEVKCSKMVEGFNVGRHVCRDLDW